MKNCWLWGVVPQSGKWKVYVNVGIPYLKTCNPGGHCLLLIEVNLVELNIHTHRPSQASSTRSSTNKIRGLLGHSEAMAMAECSQLLRFGLVEVVWWFKKNMGWLNTEGTNETWMDDVFGKTMGWLHKIHSKFKHLQNNGLCICCWILFHFGVDFV